MNLFRKFIVGISAAVALFSASPSPAQVNPFNPDFAWCNIRGSLAVRGPTKWQCLPVGTNGQLLQSSGSGSTPIWITPGGGGTGTVTSVGMTVPSTMTLTGSPIIGAGTLALDFSSFPAGNVLGRDTTSGLPIILPIRSVMNEISTTQGAVLYRGSTTWERLLPGTGGQVLTTQGAGQNPIWANPTYAPAAANTIISNITGSTAAPVANTYTNVLDAAISNVRGTIAVRGASSWGPLAPGVSGQFLQTGGPGNDPAWATGNTVTFTPPTGRLSAGAQPMVTLATLNSNRIYYVPFLGNTVPIFDGTAMRNKAFSTISAFLDDVTKSPTQCTADSLFDIFIWSDAGVLTLSKSAAWTNYGARSQGLSSQDGVLVNSVSITNGPAANYGTYLGTIYCETLNQIQWRRSAANISIPIWNQYNRVPVTGTATGATASWTYNSTTWRFTNNSTAQNRARVLRGQNYDGLSAEYSVQADVGATSFAQTGVVVESVGATPTNAFSVAGANRSSVTAKYYDYPSAGLVVLNTSERTSAAITTTFYGGIENMMTVTTTY